jgi:cyanophycin synthetase
MKELNIRRILTLRGPNIWANFPVIEAWVDLGDLKDSPSTSLPGFNDRLTSWLPSMIEHRCSIGERGGFFQRLHSGTYPAHILEHVTLELQTLAGTPVGYGKARETSEEGVYKVVFRYQDENLGRECLTTARELLIAAIYDQPFDVAGEVRRLRDFADKFCLGPSTLAIVEAARARGIPHRRLDSRRSLVQLGTGSKQRRIWTAETDRTGAIAECIAQDKELTKSLLHAAGVPVPKGRQVSGPDDAWAAAMEIGLPVVVKPLDGNHGRGVFVGLTSRELVQAAFVDAIREGSGVLVERFVPGVEHRLLVVGQKIIAAARGEPIAVIGDGVSSIRKLIEQQLNTDPRRGKEETSPLDYINTEEFDPSVLGELRQQGFVPDSVPHARARVLIERVGTWSTDVTDLVHADVGDCAILAAEVVGLDIAGVDIVCRDISQPLESQSGAIVEVNSSPSLLMHLKPSDGVSRPVGEAIVDTLFPHGETGRVPIVAVTGTNGKTIVTRLIAHVLKGAFRRVGLACTDGIYLNGRRTESGDCSGPQSARALLLNPRTDVAVMEVARGGILREGLGFDRCQVGVVLNLADADHLGEYYIDTVDSMAKVKCCVIDVVLPDGMGILNADDNDVAEMASACKGKVTYFSMTSTSELVKSHCTDGGRAVYVRDGLIRLCDGNAERAVCPVDRIPLTAGGTIRFQIQNVLAAIACCWALNVPDELIFERLATFTPDRTHVPGRFNVFPFNGATIIVDNCHNASAIKELSLAIDQLKFRQRGIIFSCEMKHRRDVDLVQQGQLLGEAFDRVWLYPNGMGLPHTLHSISMIRQGLAQSNARVSVHETDDREVALQSATASLRSGDLLIVQSGDIDATCNAVEHFVQGTVHIGSTTNDKVPVVRAKSFEVLEELA